MSYMHWFNLSGKEGVAITLIPAINNQICSQDSPSSHKGVEVYFYFMTDVGYKFRDCYK